jgi:hypothetical protein
MDSAGRFGIDPKSPERKMTNRMKNYWLRFGIVITATCLLAACGGSPHPQAVGNSGAVDAPAAIELHSEVRVATLYFPAGIYMLTSTDKIGYYYRAPRKILQHTAASSFPRDGGIFVSKRSHDKLRGYIYLGGAITHVGNFSKTDYVFRNNNEESDIPAAGPY